ncbi:DnaB-like helicase N-terminal domain-containing protein (plasmid) [Saccharopolyspora sp. ID03-671]|uniref:DnaB-like helicase N-terminal domain-containing protein n=1 Tax=Saccharopolyspora sp. ID03-671 TaxID=3073066 RepID=UPI0030F3E42D
MNPRDFAERSLLGVLLDSPGRIRALDWLEADDFRSPAHQVLYTIITDMVAEHDAERDDGPDFDFRRDVIGNDIVVGGVVYDSTRYKLDGYGDVVELSAAETEERLDEELRAHYEVPGVTPVTVLERLQQSSDPSVQRSSALTAPGLHQLIATAPPNRVAQPEAYARIVLESSIRRQVQAAGIRVGQAAETSPDLADMLGVVTNALTEVDHAQQRWSALTDRTGGELAPRAPLDVAGLDGERPTTEATRDAEYGLISEAIANPRVLDELDLANTVTPEDFADPELGNTWRATVAVHASAAATGTRVDVITVAWEQQRQSPVHGEGLDVEDLAEAGQTIPLGDGHAQHCADAVLRGSISRLTHTAAESVTKAAQHPGLQPADVLHTSTTALDAVLHKASRGSQAAALAQQASPARPAATTPPAPAQQVCNTVPLRPGRGAATWRDEIGR